LERSFAWGTGSLWAKGGEERGEWPKDVWLKKSLSEKDNGKGQGRTRKGLRGRGDEQTIKKKGLVSTSAEGSKKEGKGKTQLRQQALPIIL